MITICELKIGLIVHVLLCAWCFFVFVNWYLLPFKKATDIFKIYILLFWLMSVFCYPFGFIVVVFSVLSLKAGWRGGICMIYCSTCWWLDTFNWCNLWDDIFVMFIFVGLCKLCLLFCCFWWFLVNWYLLYFLSKSIGLTQSQYLYDKLFYDLLFWYFELVLFL